MPFSCYSVTEDTPCAAPSFGCREMRCRHVILGLWILDFWHVMGVAEIHVMFAGMRWAVGRVCWEMFWLVLLKITPLSLLVAGKYFTPRRVCGLQLQCSRLRVMPYIHPSWPPTERSTLPHSAFALLNSKEFCFFVVVFSCQESKENDSWLTL